MARILKRRTYAPRAAAAGGVLPDALAQLLRRALARLNADLRLLIRTMRIRDDRAAYTPLADL